MTCAVARRFYAHLGRRGTFLLILGTGKTAFGVGLVVQPPSPQGLQLLLYWAPMRCWAWVWILAGVVTAGAAFLQVGRDRWGYLAALVPPSVWACAYLTAALTGEYPRGAWLAIWYLTSHIGVIVWAAGVPEHSVPRRRRSPGVRGEG